MKKQKSLEEQIEERKKEAKEKDISGKLFSIIQYLGYTSDNSYVKHGYLSDDDYGRYSDKNFVMTRESNYSYDHEGGGGGYFKREIYYLEEIVYKDFSGDIDIYKPGIWEEKVEALYSSSLLAKEKQEKLREEKKEKEKLRKQKEFEDEAKKNFGL